MPRVNVFEYIGLTRATESAVLVSARGEATAIPASDVPAALHVATNGQFKREWAPHMHARAHINSITQFPRRGGRVGATWRTNPDL